MSGSSSSSGGGGGVVDDADCSSVVFETQLTSPKEYVIEQISVGDTLNISVLQSGERTLVVALYHGEVAGGITSPSVTRLRECIDSGFDYVATVTSKNDGQIRVRIEPAG